MPLPFDDIPELTNLQAGRGLIRIPMEQDVPFTDRVRAIVDTAEFQRLHHITQLGLASRVYPGATHTRFEHALGVYHNSLRYLWQLQRDARFCEVVDVHTAEVLIVAALLHDLGHWPYCHPIEDMELAELPPHEHFAEEFLAPESELGRVLIDQWNINPDEVLDVLIKRSDAPEQRLIQSILSGPIDIDKMDYLDRDSLHAGVPYGRNFDRNRLIQSLLVNEAGDGLAISVKGKTAAELMVFARYVMFSEVYWHHAVRSATCMFAHAFYRLHNQLDLVAFFRMTESETIRTLRQIAKATTSKRLVEGIFGSTRALYKRVAEYSQDQSSRIYDGLSGRKFQALAEFSQQLADRLSTKLGREVFDTDILIDAPPPHREVEFRVDIFDPKRNLYRPLSDISPVVRALATTQFDDYVKRVRVFANPTLAPDLADLPDLDSIIEDLLDSDG